MLLTFTHSRLTLQSSISLTKMFIYVTYGENLEELFNINVTNNILLDYVKTYTRTKMLDQINEKKFMADSMLGDLERDLERKQKIQGEVENPDDESEDIRETKTAISAWESFLNQELKPYLDILNSKDLVVDFQGDAKSQFVRKSNSIR